MIFGDEELLDDTPFEAIRVGVVSSIDRKKSTVRVYFEDREEAVSHDLKVIVPQTMKTKYYYMPDVDETVICGFLASGQETGFILGSVYSEIDKPVPEISDDGKTRVGIWIDNDNYIKWVEEDRKFIVKTEKPIEFIVGDG